MKELKEYDFPSGEILLINKPLGWSSFDVVRKLRKFFGAKTGHAGTLDPLATGLMILATGPLTKKLNEIQNLPKEYTGAFFIGAATPSYDRETSPGPRADTSSITEQEIQNAAKQFTGRIMQSPPVFSAIKIDGKRSYLLARKGREKKLDA